MCSVRLSSAVTRGAPRWQASHFMCFSSLISNQSKTLLESPYDPEGEISNQYGFVRAGMHAVPFRRGPFARARLSVDLAE